MNTPNSPSPAQKFLPLAAVMLAGTVGAVAPTQAQNLPIEKTLKTVTVKDKLDADIAEGKNSVRVTETRIGKGKQQLRDIPQSVTVVTEKLIDDRNLETVKEALKNTAGISFLAAEGGEEDIRLRGFSLQAAGDVFADGVRDPAFYERDTFNLDRLEVLRGSASMLFGRGSTGGAVNQVNKTPRLMDESQIDLTLGTHNHTRLVGDFNKTLGEGAALRLSVMKTKADNNGAGSRLDKEGVAAAYRWGIGERDEFLVGLYHLDNRNGINYGMPFIRPTPTSPVTATTLLPLDPTAYYGAVSDRNHGSASYMTLAHTRRMGGDSELRTVVRKGSYARDQRTGAIRLGDATLQGGTAASLETFGPPTVLTRGTHLKIQNMNTLHAQSDFSHRFEALGFKHQWLSGVDVATEDKTVYAARTAAQGGVDITKGTTLIGTPNDGAWFPEDTRVLRVNNQYASTSWGAYAQDLMQIAPKWKVLAGLRYDRLNGDYDQFAAPANAEQSNGAKTSYRMKVGEWSQRAGVLFQPDSLQSYHFSYGTSFNTSGDTYSLSAANASTPPEQSVNMELGAKLDSADKRFTTRLALFHGVKKNERNTDPLLPVNVLSGERYVRGFEIDLAGRLTPMWEVFGSFAWMPDAKVTQAAPCPTSGQCTQGAAGERPGDRPALIPQYSGTLWNTYRIDSQWRVGWGLTFRGKQKPLRSEFEVPAFVVGDLMAEYIHSDELTFKLNVSNVANKLYADMLYPAHYVPGAGRLTQLTGSYRF